jgi:glycine dehydrogenase subunit 2
MSTTKDVKKSDGGSPGGDKAAGATTDVQRSVMPGAGARTEPIIFELSVPGHVGYQLEPLDVPDIPVEELLPHDLRRRTEPRLPEVTEPQVVRHFTRISVLNHHIDRDVFPLGSCTMKYNPKVNETVAGLPGFANLHPLAPEQATQGALAQMADLARYLAVITGMDRVTLQPAAGAQGEFTGLLIARAFFRDRGESERMRVIFPDSAHGTNPASAAMCGFEPVEIKSDARGLVDLEALSRALDSRAAVFMVTNPNTLGLFEEDILAIATRVHEAGALLYLDGANLNALAGVARPGEMGFDICHLNLHKTFSTPHGGGGPGSGPVGVKARLEPYLPRPTIEERGGRYVLEWDRPRSVGKVHSFYGNFGMHVRALAYILALGPNGIREATENAVLNANYLKSLLVGEFDLPYAGPSLHEFVLSGDRQKAHGVRTADMAKRLLDHGFYAPTVYFPLIVHEALMIEPTESETKESLDRFAAALVDIAREARETPEVLHEAPHSTPVRRLDEARAARELKLRWRP